MSAEASCNSGVVADDLCGWTLRSERMFRDSSVFLPIDDSWFLVLMFLFFKCELSNTL